MLKMDQNTRWGKVVGIGIRAGERYYFFLDKYGMVALIPASIVEEHDDLR
jgi:hypothetical protein